MNVMESALQGAIFGSAVALVIVVLWRAFTMMKTKSH
jgi:hypothetical protein